MPAGRVAVLGVLAAALHGAFDAACWPSRWTRPPYLRVEDMPEGFAGFLSPVGISIAVSIVSGIIAALAIVAVEPARGERVRTLAVVLGAFWCFSALLTQVTWLSTPWSYAVTSVPLGFVRGAAIAAVASLLLPRLDARRGAL